MSIAAMVASIGILAADAALTPTPTLDRAAEVVKTERYFQQKNVVYEESHGVALVMDIFEPTKKKNGLAIVLVASGSYHSDRSKVEMFKRAQMYDIFCERGYCVFAIRPGSVTKFSLPEMLANVKTGIRWVKAHAKDFGIDPDRLGLTGASAGGHLCCLAAVTMEAGKEKAKDKLGVHDTRVKAACAFFPPTDFMQYGKSGLLKIDVDKPPPAFLGPLLFPKGTKGFTKEQLEKVILDASPARRVTKDTPPFLLVHGDADIMVPLQQSERMKEALQTAGIPVQMIVKPGGGHPWPTIHEEVKVAADWFDKNLSTAATN